MRLTFRELAARREARISGYMTKYVYSEYWKALLRILLLKDSKTRTFSHNKMFFLNIDTHTFKKILYLYQLDASDLQLWGPTQKNLYNALAIYFPASLICFLRKFNELVVTTDMNIANYNTMSKCSKSVRKVCVQHGFFPVTNTSDIDGLNADHYVVRSKSQAQVLVDAGFLGSIQVTAFNQKKILNASGPEQLIFVGPGFSHNRKYEESIFNIILRLAGREHYQLIYRPHPRCSDWLRKRISDIKVPLDNTRKSSLSGNTCKYFIGVKSTMLIDAQEIGHRVVLVVGDDLPQYFAHGDIKNWITIDDLDLLFT